MRNLILTGAVAIIFGFLFGYFVKYCPKCEECVEKHVVIEDKKVEKIEKMLENKREEIKKETNEKLDYIDTVRVHKLDSIWTEFAHRYGH